MSGLPASQRLEVYNQPQNAKGSVEGTRFKKVAAIAYFGDSRIDSGFCYRDPVRQFSGILFEQCIPVGLDPRVLFQRSHRDVTPLAPRSLATCCGATRRISKNALSRRKDRPASAAQAPRNVLLDRVASAEQ